MIYGYLWIFQSFRVFGSFNGLCCRDIWVSSLPLIYCLFLIIPGGLQFGRCRGIGFARWIFDRNGGFSPGKSFANQSLRGGFKYVFMFFLTWGDDLQLGWNHQVGQEWCALNSWIWYTFGIFSGLAEKRFVKFLLRRTLLQMERFTLPETNIAPKNGGFP